MFTRSWFAALCGCAIAACSGSHTLTAQSVASSKMPVSIRGEFREDGSCQVFADGRAMFNPADSARTLYIHDGILSALPSVFDAHEIWCGLRGPEQLMAPLDLSARRLMVLLYAPSGKLVQARSYEVGTGAATTENADHLAGVAVFGVQRRSARSRTKTRLGYLEGRRGVVEITHVDTGRVVGTFAFVARATQ